MKKLLLVPPLAPALLLPALPLLAGCLLLAGCATTETGKVQRDPAFEKEQRTKRNRLRKQRTPEIGKVLLDFDRLLESYFEARKAQGNKKVEQFIATLRKNLRERVARYEIHICRRSPLVLTRNSIGQSLEKVVYGEPQFEVGSFV